MKKTLPLLAVVLLASCGKNVVLDELHSFKDSRWHMDSVVTVVWEPEQSEDPVFMSMYIRHSTEYPYNNLFLFRSIESTQGVEYTDTVNVALADPLGVWNGSGMSNLKTLEIPIGQGAVRFRDDERYTLKITQGMRDTVLYGIQDVGVQFEQVKSAEK
ncbi:MAG: Gliding motility lipoprotein GldH [Cryomorphaceae bacterium]|nr:MAG: Gliding motility lipoprotein GldH [Cryomorphaceae bacterium]